MVPSSDGSRIIRLVFVLYNTVLYCIIRIKSMQYCIFPHTGNTLYGSVGSRENLAVTLNFQNNFELILTSEAFTEHPQWSFPSILRTISTEHIPLESLL